MVKIGITGNIASGKSMVEGILRRMKYTVYDADILAHKVLEEKSDIVKSKFQGYDIIDGGKISRKKLGEIVFDKPELKIILENIIHPEVIKIIKSIQDTKAVFVSVPLLFEAKMENLFDKIILVCADENTRVERLIKRNSLSKAQALARVKAQLPQKCKIADFVIDNNGNPDNLLIQVKEFLRINPDIK